MDINIFKIKINGENSNENLNTSWKEKRIKEEKKMNKKTLFPI